MLHEHESHSLDRRQNRDSKIKMKRLAEEKAANCEVIGKFGLFNAIPYA